MRKMGFVLLAGLWLWLLAGCGGQGEMESQGEPETAVLTLPTLEPVALDGGKLRVVATTSIIGDVVAQVGGEAIALTTLMEAGQDSHSYQPGAGDLTAVAAAQVVFVNGWGLEEGLLDDLANIAAQTPLVPVSAGVEPLVIGADEHEDEHEEAHEHGGIDPHVWFNPDHVVRWVGNIEQTLSQLDPNNAASYASNAAAYVAQLKALAAYMDSQVALIPLENRVLVTNHDALSYFVERYRFKLLGTVIPAASTLAEPSATDLAALVEAMTEADVCVLFAETTMNGPLETAVANELAHCETVEILTLYTDALGAVGTQADSYVGMMRANVETFVAGLKN